jgi:hypothetical protein
LSGFELKDTIMTPTNALSIIEASRTGFIGQVNRMFDDLVAQFTPTANSSSTTTIADFKQPTPSDGLDSRNKNGQNLTPRGVEILYRVFDDAGGYNRAAKMLNITQAAAKSRKASWAKAGGINRQKAILDIDATS